MNQLVKVAFESTLQKLPFVLDKSKDEQIKVACISFGFRNMEIINFLITRGTALANGKLKLVRQWDETINKQISYKREVLQQPVVAFVTFQTQEGFERCEKHLFKESRHGDKKKKGLSLLGCPADIKEAPEPSNIIWENLSISHAT